tara:strand:- start:397 stop:924 length:528 start_codon:yes stop_codon:yes gene_type:complete
MLQLYIGLRLLNDAVAKLATLIAMGIVALASIGLTGSAVTRFVTGNGYDWLIELPPFLIPWLVFPMLGPLLRASHHIKVDVLPVFLSDKGKDFLQILVNLLVLVASSLFVIAGKETVDLYKRLGKIVELEITFPIWYLYLAFPVGFVILAFSALEVVLGTVLKQQPYSSRDIRKY